MSSVESTALESRVEEEGEEIMDDEEEEEEEEVEDEEDEVEEEDDEEEGDHIPVTVSRRTGRGLTLKTLLKERVLEPGAGFMTINYLGNKFKGDLLPDGRIRSQETNKIFGTPSAWAIYCKKIVNPDKKSGCGWASVRYRGKKLDSYKNNWFRQKRLEDEKEEEEMEEEESGSESEEAGPHEQEIIEFEILGNRNPNHDPSTMIELSTFQATGRMQPFNITMSSSAMAVIDVHGHLTTSEVVGYLAGQWDVNNHNLIVSHAFPVRCRLGDGDKGPGVEQDLYTEMSRLKLSLVGWYHTHPFTPPLPTIRDIDSQLDYEMKMKGYNDASYTPVLGIIVSPYQKAPLHEKGIPHPNGNATGFWVMPPAENKPLEYGKPMSMQFTVVQDAFIPKEALLHMSEIVKYYKESPDAVELTDIFEEKFTFWHKLKSSLRGRVPKDHFQPLIDFLVKVIDRKLPEDDPIPPLPAATPAPMIPHIPSSLAVSAAHLPSSTSISVVEKEAMDNLNLTKDLESCVSNILRASMGADLIPISSSITTTLAHRDKENSVTISPFTPTLVEKSGEEHVQPSSSRPKSREGKISPKSYSPLFQLPPPPLFSLEPGKSQKDNFLSKPFPPLNLQLDEKRFVDARSSGAMSSILKGDKSTDEKMPLGMSPLDYKFLLEYTNKQKKKEAEALSSGYLDLSMISSKDVTEGKDKKALLSDSQKKEVKDGKSAPPVDLSSWFAHAKALQEAYAFPHERDSSLARSTSPATHKELSSYFPSDIFASQWNPSAAAAAMHLSRETAGLSVGGGGVFHPSLNFSSDSKPTYHSDVPILLKKQQEEFAKDALAKEAAQILKDSSRNLMEDERARREFKMPSDYKDRKDIRDQLKDIERLGQGKNLADELRFKEPKLYSDPKDLRSDTGGIYKGFGEVSKAVIIPSHTRDTQEINKKHMSQYDYHHESRKDVSDQKVPHEAANFSDSEKFIRDSRNMRDLEKSKEMSESEESRETSEHIEIRSTSPSQAQELRGMAAPKFDRNEIRDVPMNLSDIGYPKESSRIVSPMDMTTFKIKRDPTNPEVRHFIEPSCVKRPIDTKPHDYSDGKDNNKSHIDSVLNLAQTDTGKEANNEDNMHSSEVNQIASDRRTPVSNISIDMSDSRPVINLRDPSSLMEAKTSRSLSDRDDHTFVSDHKNTFSVAHDPSIGEGSENLSMPPEFIPHQTPSTNEPMDYE